MKINICLKFLVTLTLFILNSSIKLRGKNPDETLADINGGNNGEFLRRNQPQEHIIIPLINSLEAEYTPLADIRKSTEEILKEEERKLRHMEITKGYIERAYIGKI